MFKKLIANKGKEFAGKLANFAATTNAKLNAPDAKPEQGGPSAPVYSIDQKPFKINLNELYQYDYEELSECVHQYEDYVVFLRQKCHESMKACSLLEQELEQLKQSRNASGDKTDTTKHSQQALDLFEPSVSAGFSPSSSKERWEAELKQIEDYVTEKVCVNCVDEGLLKGITETTNNMVEQLTNIRDQLFQSTAGSESEILTVQLKKSAQDELINVIGDIEMTVQLVFPKLLDINPKIKNQEKLIIKEILQKVESLLMKSKQDSQIEEVASPSPDVAKIALMENEYKELKEQLEEAKLRIAELEKDLEEKNNQPQVEEENNKVVATEEEEEEEENAAEAGEETIKYQQEIKSLNENKKELEKKIKDLDASLKKSSNSCKEYEAKIKQGDEKISTLEKAKKELESALDKTKKELENTLEKTRKEHESALDRNKKDNERQLKETEAKIKELEQKLREAEERYKELDKRKKEGDVKINHLRSQAEESKEQFEWLRKEHQRLISTTEKAEGEVGEEFSKMQERIETLEKEKQTLHDKAIEAELSKTDMENKLIQERLRHHQTVVDMQKLNETLKQTEKNLDEEMEAHRKSLDKNEAYKSKLIESDKKRVDYKKTIKKLSQQILELHNKLNDQNKKEESQDETDKNNETKEELITEGIQDAKFTDRDLVSSPTTAFENREFGGLDGPSLKQLQIQLEEALHEITNLKDLSSKLTNENKSLVSQNKVLQEKREIGLQEIQKLSQSLEKLRAQYPDLDYTGISQSAIPKEVYQPGSGLSINRMNSNSSSMLGQNDSSPLSHIQRQSSLTLTSQPGKSNLVGLKKQLEQLYKEVIMALTNETIISIKQKSGGQAELELEQSLVKIEKKVNDMILLLNDYSELITKFFKKNFDLQN